MFEKWFLYILWVKYAKSGILKQPLIKAGNLKTISVNFKSVDKLDTIIYKIFSKTKNSGGATCWTCSNGLNKSLNPSVSMFQTSEHSSYHRDGDEKYSFILKNKPVKIIKPKMNLKNFIIQNNFLLLLLL